MPHLNKPATHVTHGVGGGFAGVDNAPIGPLGGVCGWRDDRTVAFANGDDAWIVSTYDIVTRAIHRIDFPDLVRRPRDKTAIRHMHVRLTPPSKRKRASTTANIGFAGGGHVAAWFGAPGDDRGLYSTTGLRLRDAGLMGVGPDAAIGYKPVYHSNGPTLVREINGNEYMLTQGHADALQLLGEGRAIWQEGFAVHVRGLPTPAYDASGGVWRPMVTFAAGEWWISYYSGARGIVLHPLTDTNRCYSILPKGDGWHTIGALSSDVIRIIVSSGIGEQPGQIWGVDLNVRTGHGMRWKTGEPFTLLLQPISDINRVVNPPPPPPEKKMELPQNVYDTYVQCVARFPHTGNDDQRREANRKAVATVRARHGGRYVCKSEHNLGWGSDSKDAMGYVTDGTPTHGAKQKIFMWDMINGTTRQPNPRGTAESARDAYVLIPEAFDWLIGIDPIDPGEVETHMYIGGGNDTNECDTCHKSRFDDVHAIPQSKEKHVYNGGEQDTGLCDVCQKTREHDIHQIVTPPPPPRHVFIPLRADTTNTGPCASCGKLASDLAMHFPIEPEEPPVDKHDFVGSATAKFCSECGEARTAAVHQKDAPAPVGVDLTPVVQRLDTLIAGQEAQTAAINRLRTEVVKAIKDASALLPKLFGKGTRR